MTAVGRKTAVAQGRAYVEAVAFGKRELASDSTNYRPYFPLITVALACLS